MPNTKEGESQENVILPEDLIRRVEDYRFEHRLRSKKDAYRDLLERGLKQAAAEKEASR